MRIRWRQTSSRRSSFAQQELLLATLADVLDQVDRLRGRLRARRWRGW